MNSTPYLASRPTMPYGDKVAGSWNSNGGQGDGSYATTDDLRAECKRSGVRCIEVLKEILECSDRGSGSRLHAARLLLEIGYGDAFAEKPTKSEPSKPLPPPTVTADEVRALEARMRGLQ